MMKVKIFLVTLHSNFEIPCREECLLSRLGMYQGLFLMGMGSDLGQ